MSATIRQLLAALLIAAIAGLTGWVLAINARVSVVETQQGAAVQRLESLESGRTTPISAEARARFEAVQIQLDAIRGQLAELNRRLRDAAAHDQSFGDAFKGG